MERRFSSEELHALRNQVPIKFLIKELLGIPCKEIEGVFRFLCPHCREFQTAINPKTNLSRCFRCRRNFNTIEMVMEDKHLGFVESVKFLKRLFGKSVFPSAAIPAGRDPEATSSLNIS